MAVYVVHYLIPWREDGILIKKNEQRSGEGAVAHQNSTTDMHPAGPVQLILG